MSEEKTDRRVVAEPGSPVSLRKIVESGATIAPFTVLVDGTPERAGVVADDPNTYNVLVADREEQARYFIGLGLPMPAYLRKYLAVLYGEVDLDAMYKNALSNKGLLQMIGLIQMVGGAFNVARKAGKGIRIYVEMPETFLHPAQQAAVTDLIIQLRKDYGLKEETPAEGAKP